MTCHNQHNPFSRNLTISIGLVVFLSIIFVCTIWVDRQKHYANEQLYQSHLLMSELRQSSDDLTRMVRTYVVTGNPVYKQHYQDILDIRNGKKPRPVDAWRIYWDLILPDNPTPRGSQPAIALLDLMRQSGYTHEEFNKLAVAAANSDALTTLEYEAMKLVETGGTNARANQVRARMLVHEIGRAHV